MVKSGGDIGVGLGEGKRDAVSHTRNSTAKPGGRGGVFSGTPALNDLASQLAIGSGLGKLG